MKIKNTATVQRFLNEWNHFKIKINHAESELRNHRNAGKPLQGNV